MHANDSNYTTREYDQLVNCYLSEMREMNRATQMPFFRQILNNLQNYSRHLKSRRKINSPLTPLIEASNGTRIINVSKLTPALLETFYTAHFAACCILNKNRQYSINEMAAGSLMNQAQSYITGPEMKNRQISQPILQSINNMDAVRTIQLLRLTGLITRQSSTMRQLALGAAGGLKDIYFLHALPSITLSKTVGVEQVLFNYEFQTAADIIVSDSDPRFEQTYNNYAQDTTKSITGYINDTMSLLEYLASKGIQKRNLVSMLRIEPAMIDSTSKLLKNLAPHIDDSCDFIFSIGAGDSLEAYQNRIDVTSQLFEDLNSAGLKPVLFQMHHGGTAEEQGRSLQFGSMAASSYEILYCRLNAKALRNTFS